MGLLVHMHPFGTLRNTIFKSFCSFQSFFFGHEFQTIMSVPGCCVLYCIGAKSLECGGADAGRPGGERGAGKKKRCDCCGFQTPPSAVPHTLVRQAGQTGTATGQNTKSKSSGSQSSALPSRSWQE